MSCETEMHVHYVLTAQNLFKEAQIEINRKIRLDLLNQAMVALRNAEELGVKPAELNDLRNRIKDAGFYQRILKRGYRGFFGM